MDVAVRIHGGIAETVVTARFDNPGKELSRGQLHARNAGRIGRHRLCARHRRADDRRRPRRSDRGPPRLRIAGAQSASIRASARSARDFEFKTRVYPIDPGKSRTVRVRFVTPLDPSKGYELPLSNEQEIGRFTLSVEASGLSRASPVSRSPESRGPRVAARRRPPHLLPCRRQGAARRRRSPSVRPDRGALAADDRPRPGRGRRISSWPTPAPVMTAAKRRPAQRRHALGPIAVARRRRSRSRRSHLVQRLSRPRPARIDRAHPVRQRRARAVARCEIRSK